MENIQTLTLKEYMYNNRLTIAQVAAMVDYSQGHVQGIVSGKFPVSRKFARSIEKATQGIVTQKTVLTRVID